MTRSERVRIVALIACAACVGLAPRAASAAEAGPDPLVPFEEGRTLVRSGRYAEALGKFDESYRIKATSGALLNMADCFEKLGRYASASTAFERAAVLATENNQVERAQEAVGRLAAVSSLVSRLTVKAPSESMVTIDGEAVTIGSAQPVDGGEHVVRVVMHCRGANEVRVNIGLRSDDHVVSVEPGPRSSEPECGRPPPTINVFSPPERPGSSWGSQKTVAVVLGGASLVALGAGIGFGLSAASKKDELATACRNYPSGCPLDRRDELETTYDDASRAAAYSTLGIVAGVVFLGAAVGLYLTAPKYTSRIARSAARIEF